MPVPGAESRLSSAGGTSTWATSSEKLPSPCVSACRTARALAGAVVSKPTAKNTTSRSGSAAAMRTAEAGARTIIDGRDQAKLDELDASLPSKAEEMGMVPQKGALTIDLNGYQANASGDKTR